MFNRINHNQDNKLWQSYVDGDIDEFRNLIESGENVNCLVGQERHYFSGCSLISAVIENYLDVEAEKNKQFFDILISNNVHLGTIGRGKSLITSAMSFGDNSIYFTEELLKINKTTSFGTERTSEKISSKDFPPIFLAVASGSIEQMDLLFKYNVDLKELGMHNETILNFILDHKPELALKLFPIFIKNGADPEQKGSNHETCLYKICYHNNALELFNIIYTSKTNMNSLNVSKQTPIMAAFTYKNTNLAKLYIDKGSDVNMQDVYGKTASMYAVIKIEDNYEMFDNMSSFGVNFEIKDNYGDNLFHYMGVSFLKIQKSKDKKHFMRFLLEHKKLLEEKNSRGHTPLSYIKERSEVDYNILSNAIKNDKKSINSDCHDK